MITLETADNALKSFYLDAVTESLNLKTNPLLAQIQQSTADVVGKDVKKLVKYGVSGGISAGSETGGLPTPSESGRYQLTSTLKNLYGTIEISDKALRASANSEGAFVNLLNDEMQTLVKSASFNFGRMMYGDGSGLLTGLNNLAEDHMIPVESTKNLMEGMLVDLTYTNGETIEGMGGLKIVKIDRQNNRVFLDGPVLTEDVPDNAAVYLHGSRGYELTGLNAIFGEGDLYGLDREIAPFLTPYVMEDAGDMTESLIQTAIDAVEENSGSRVNFIVCSWGVKRALMEYCRNHSIMYPTVEVAGGFKAISFHGIPVVADRFCAAGTMYLLNTDDFKIHQLCDWKWLEGEDGKILKQVPGKPVYTATLVKYAELMCERPNAQGMITDINEA